MAGLDYCLVARWLHGLSLLRGNPPVSSIRRCLWEFGFNTKGKSAILQDPLGLSWHRKVIQEYLRSSSIDWFCSINV